MTLWQRIVEALGRGPRKWRDADSVRCSGYPRDVMRAEFDAAVRLLGGELRGTWHRIKSVKAVDGKKYVAGKGWAFPSKASPTGWAGADVGAGVIRVARDPKTKAPNMGLLSHEFGHSLLNENSDVRGIEAQHVVMRRVGLM